MALAGLQHLLTSYNHLSATHTLLLREPRFLYNLFISAALFNVEHLKVIVAQEKLAQPK